MAHGQRRHSTWCKPAHMHLNHAISRVESVHLAKGQSLAMYWTVCSFEKSAPIVCSSISRHRCFSFSHLSKVCVSELKARASVEKRLQITSILAHN
jgi:hypothetical protein